VYRNGVKLGTADFTATSGTTVVLASGATAGDLVETVSFYVSSVLNAIPAVANAVTETYINDGAVTTAKIADANVTADKLSTGSPSWDGSGNLSFNSGYGSDAVAYGCRAWVNFNGTGTVAIRGSGNVSSISDFGTGLYRMNFATNMPDINFSAVGNCAQTDSNQDGTFGDFITFYSYDVTDVNISTCNDSSTVMNLTDMVNVTAAIFR
jgi:hypothetical protein